MNYLAHFHLAGGDEGLIIGALLGDFVKGPLRGEYPAAWERGIRVHRRIDAITDRHPEVRQLLEELPPQYRRYGGIMLDVCFDHCLSRHWADFHSRELPDFSAGIYRTLMLSAHHFPEPARRQAQRLAHYDVLGGMRHWQTVENMLARIGQRLRRENPLHESSALLRQRLDSVDAAFFRLYPAVVAELEREFGIAP